MQAYVRLLTVLSLVLVLAGGLYFGAENGWGRVRSVEFALAPGSEEQVLFTRVQGALAERLKILEGQWLWKVSLPDVLLEVENDRRVREVQISRVFPNGLKITLTPHHPVLGLPDGEGRIFPVATDASLLPALNASEVPDVPLLRGARFFSDVELRQRALKVFDQLPTQGLFSRANVAEITFDKNDGFQFLLTRSATVVRVGHDDIGQKASRVEQVLNYLQDQQLQGRVIDARFSKKVVVRLRNGS